MSSFDAEEKLAKFRATAAEQLKHRAKQLDQWALDHPEQAAVAGVVIGVVTSVAMNKVMLIRGTAAAISCVYGGVKGGLTGYSYGKAKTYAAGRYTYAREQWEKGYEATMQTGEAIATRAAEEFRRRRRGETGLEY